MARAGAVRPPDLRGGAAEARPEEGVEAPQAAEPGGEGHLRHGQAAVLQQALRQGHAARLRQGHRRHAQLGDDGAAQVAAAHPQPGGQRLHRALVERAGPDARDGRGHQARQRVDRAGAGGELRATAEAGPVTRALGLGGVREEGAAVAAGRAGRADRPAVHAGGPDADQEAAVEARVARRQRAPAGVGVELHAAPVYPGPRGASGRFRTSRPARSPAGPALSPRSGSPPEARPRSRQTGCPARLASLLWVGPP